MENETQENLDSINETEQTENQETEQTVEPEDVETLKKKISTLEAQKEHWRNKAEKPKEVETEVKNEPKHDGLSSKDVIYFTKNPIHEDDIDEVLDWAKFKRISVSEAHKQLKTTLQVREEERRSAETANTRNARQGSSQVTVERLMSDAQAGKLPEKDDDIQRVLKAKMGIKK